MCYLLFSSSVIAAAGGAWGANTPGRAWVPPRARSAHWIGIPPRDSHVTLNCRGLFRGYLTSLPQQGHLFHQRLKVQVLLWGEAGHCLEGTLFRKRPLFFTKCQGESGAPHSLPSAFQAHNVLHSSNGINSAEQLEEEVKEGCFSPRQMRCAGIKALFKGILPTHCSSGNFYNQFWRIDVAKSDRSDFMCCNIVGWCSN